MQETVVIYLKLQKHQILLTNRFSMLPYLVSWLDSAINLAKQSVSSKNSFRYCYLNLVGHLTHELTMIDIYQQLSEHHHTVINGCFNLKLSRN